MTHWRSGMRMTPARLGERESGEKLVTFTGTSNTTHTVVFTEAFSSAPYVQSQCVSSSGVTAQFEARPINITATGFTLWVTITDIARTSQVWSSIPVHWTAEL